MAAPLSPFKKSAMYESGNRIYGWQGKSQAGSHDFYLDNVQPIFAKRCVTCHGCYEAACQLNMQSYKGVHRGYNPIPIYSAKRIAPTKPTEMNDVYDLKKWRALGFLPVIATDLEQGADNQPISWDKSLFFKFLKKGAENNVPESPARNWPGFDVDGLKPLISDLIDKQQPQCVATDRQYEENFNGRKNNPWNVLRVDDFFQQYPNAGMPLAFPRIEDQELAVLFQWLKDGAKGPSSSAGRILGAQFNPDAVAKWEDFFNQDSTKAQHTARYIFEHVYTALIHIEESPGEYYRLVRSTTRTGEIHEILTQFAYQPPGVNAFYYRLQKVESTLVQKKMTLWRINNARLERLKAQFLKTSWGVAKIPPPKYDGSNPFEYFALIPTEIRSRFMMENAEAIIGAMVQGSVCIGSGATYAIRDHFWVWFLKPESDISVIKPKLGQPDWKMFDIGRWKPEEDAKKTAALKAADFFKAISRRIKRFDRDIHEAESIAGYFVQTKDGYQNYRDAFERELRVWLAENNKKGLAVDDLWDGSGDSAQPDGVNPSAWLNLLRHGRSATVQFGPEGGVPENIWVLNYANYEMLYYDLVANFQATGSIALKLGTWRIMSYVRMEAEDLAISFLPLQFREQIRDRFTRGLGRIKEEMFFPLLSVLPMSDGSQAPTLPPRQTGEPGIPDTSADDAIHYLVGKIKTRLNTVSQKTYNDKGIPANRVKWEQPLLSLTGISKAKNNAAFPKFIPSIVYMKIVSNDGSGDWAYTLIANKNYESHDSLLLEAIARDPALDDISLYRGFVGAYPNVFLEIPADKTDAFVSSLKKITSEKDWSNILAQYGIARNSARFWPFFDWVHEKKSVRSPDNDPVMQGVVDISQYDFF